MFLLVLIFYNIASIAQQNIDNASPTERMIWLGDSYVVAGNYEKAKLLYTDALNSAYGIDEKWNSIDKIVDVNILIGDNKNSLQLLDQIINDEIAQRDSTMMMHINNKIGYVYYCMKDYVRSIKYYLKGKNYIKGSADRKGKAELYVNMARTLIIAGDVREAENLLNLAKEQCISESDDILANIYKLNSNIFELYGDYKKAFSYQAKQLEIEQQLWNSERLELLGSKKSWANYQKVEQNVNNEKRIKELEVEVAKQDSSNKSLLGVCRIAIILSIALIVIVIVLSIVNHRRTRKIALLEKRIVDKQKVLSIVTHDFVNPFNALIGFSELQLQLAQSKNETEMIDYARTIYQSAQSMFQMVSSLLVWSQADGQMKAKKEVLHINESVSKIIDIYKLMAEDKNITVNNLIDENVTILADKIHFDIIMRNLIANSLKFTLSGGVVNLSAVKHEGKVSVVIDDTGIGMPSDICEKINNHEFVQSTEGTMEEKGVGLGMMICIDLSRANDAVFGVDSVEGKGTAVTIIFDAE